LWKNLTALFESLDFKVVEFETFEGLFDNKKVNKIEDDLTEIEDFMKMMYLRIY
jgi:hypothetical protein